MTIKFISSAAVALMCATSFVFGAEQRRSSPFWTSLPQCQTTIYVHNLLVNEPLEVGPRLYLEDGTVIELAPINLGPTGSAEIHVNSLLEGMGYAEAHFGGADFIYERDSGGAVGIVTKVEDTLNRFAYMVESFVPEHRVSQDQDAVFWLPTKSTEVFFAMHNVDADDITVFPEISIGGNVIQLSPVSIPGHGFAKLRLPEDASLTGLQGRFTHTAAVSGSVTLHHSGAAGALLATGWVDDKITGYSNMMTFVDPANSRGQELYGAEVLLGQQSGTVDGAIVAVRSALVLKNLSSVPTSATVELFYDSGGTVASTPMALGTIPPGKTRHVEFENGRRGIPADVNKASMVVRHTGQSGALMGRIFGASDDREYGFYTALEGGPSGMRMGYYWSASSAHDTVISIANAGNTPDEVKLTLWRYGGALVRSFPLDPNEVKTISARALLEESGTVDGKGGFLIQSSDPARGRLAVAGHVTNGTTGTAMPSYATAAYVESMYFDPGFNEHYEVGEVNDFDDLILDWSNGTFTCATTADLWSNDESIATVGSGVCPVEVTGEGPGITTITAQAVVPINESGVQDTVQAQSGQNVVNCTIGVTSVTANALTSTSGNVKFRVTNGTCPSGGSNQVRVSVQPIDTQGITIQNWTPSPPVSVTVPSPSTTTSDQTLNFTVSGSGSTKFRVAIDLCNGGNCSTLKWTLNPNSVDTPQVNF